MSYTLEITENNTTYQVVVDSMAGVSNGPSAYEVAVSNGFVGTEAEWLQSLVGADGVDGVDGQDGIDGSLYDDTTIQAEVDLNTAKVGYTDAASRNAISLTSNSSSLNYNNTTGVFTYTDPTGSPIAASHIEIEVRNTTGSTIPANSAVYISGVSGNNDLISLAVNTGTNPAMGVTTSSINHNSNGIMIIGGEIGSFATGSYSENDTLYLSNVAGQLTNVRPSAETQFVQNIGRVVRSDNNGTIIVQGAGRANDIPNLDSLHVFIGDTLAPERRQLTYTDILNTPTDTDDLSEGTTNLYYTEARVSANTDVVANTAKVGITTQQSNDITANKSVVISFAVSDETTDIATGTENLTMRMPHGMTLTDVRASVTTAPVGSTIIVDVNQNGTSIFTTDLLSIDASEKTSTSAATSANITTSALTDDAEITIDIDQVGSTTAGSGLKIYLIGTKS